MKHKLSIIMSLCLLLGCGDDDKPDRPPVDTDTNCDAEATQWFTDADGDGYGDPSQAQTSCVQPEDAVDNGDDCDDTNPDSHPGAAEVCNDGAVNDCDGSLEHALEQCTLRGTLTPDDAGWVFYGEDMEDRAGINMCAAGDLNDDGFDDFVTGGYTHNEGEGKAWLVYGKAPADGLFIGEDEAPAITEITMGSLASQDQDGTIYLGQNCVGGEDLVGQDGVPDVVLGAHFFGDEVRERLGMVCVLSGAWLSSQGSSVSLDALGGGSVCFYGENEFADLSRLDGLLIDDFNDDGQADLALGAIRGGDDLAGGVYVVEGPITSTFTGLDDAKFVLYGDANHQRFGESLASADLNGDGFPELLGGGGHPNAIGFVIAAEPSQRWGQAAPPTLSEATHLEFEGITEGDSFGRYSIVAGDLTGDGYPEVIITTIYTGEAQEGRVHIYDGQALRTRTRTGPIQVEEASHVLYGDLPEEAAGLSPKLLPDMNGDGLSELLIGNNGPATGARAFLYYGRTSWRSGQLSDADVIFESGLTYAAYWGREISPIGDFNGDGVPDLAVGAHDFGEGALEKQGAVFVFFGRGI